jgi:hypothetical protein
MVLAARTEPKLITKVEAEMAGNLDIETRGLAMKETRLNKPISTIMLVRKSIKNTIFMVETVELRASERISRNANMIPAISPLMHSDQTR